jgi:hypothetical protein
MDETDPVDDGEFVYRRIHPIYFDPSLPIPVQREAFRPNQNDTTGLSVFRATFAQPGDAMANLDPDKAKDYYVVRLAVRDLRKLGLTVSPEPVPGGPPGHAVVPELSWTAYQAQKQQSKTILVELAKLASTDIIRTPGTP